MIAIHFVGVFADETPRLPPRRRLRRGHHWPQLRLRPTPTRLRRHSDRPFIRRPRRLLLRQRGHDRPESFYPARRARHDEAGAQMDVRCQQSVLYPAAPQRRPHHVGPPLHARRQRRPRHALRASHPRSLAREPRALRTTRRRHPKRLRSRPSRAAHVVQNPAHARRRSPRRHACPRARPARRSHFFSPRR